MIELKEIPGAEIAKVETKIPFLASDITSEKRNYEWHYFEISFESSKIVLIFSLLDSFCAEQKEHPASIYLTWHRENKILSYAYTLFFGNEKIIFTEKLKNFIYHKEKSLDLWIPEFSGHKLIHLNLSIDKADVSQENALENQKLHSENKHFWQFILNDKNARGVIETFEVKESKNLAEYYTVPSSFYDAPLKNKLKNTSPSRLHFSQAQVYWDHNFGFSPLSHMQECWAWWHVESENYWEVCYFFPRVKKSFFISSLIPQTEVFDHEKDQVVLKTKFSLFGYSWPQTILSKLKGSLKFENIIECAPFYLRSTLKKGKSTSHIDATIEYLIPKRVGLAFNQMLMSARQFVANKWIESGLAFESSFDFETICRKTAERNGKSFYFSSFVISKENRLKSYFIYTLCRLIDDATDEVSYIDSKTQLSGANFSSAVLNCLWSCESNIEEGLLIGLKEKISQGMRQFVDTSSVYNFIFQAKKIIEQMKLNKSYFEELVLGQIMDENFSQPQNFNEFYLYCFRVAGVVGLMMTSIFRVTPDAHAYKAAEHLGIAMQITNILRDVKEDKLKGRVYLPKDSFPGELQEKEEGLNEYIQHALCYYNSAIQGIPYLNELRVRLCVRLMAAIYGGILAKILKNKNSIFEKRIVVSFSEKCFITLKVLIGFDPLRAAGIRVRN